MIRLLIDNCLLEQLVDPQGFSRHLTSLKNLIITKEVHFITHQSIIEEWNRHKARFVRRKQQSLLAQDKLATSPFITASHPVIDKHFNDQVNAIDELLQNAQTLSTPDAVSNQLAHRLKNKLAPFHNKRDSINDWEIIGSYLHYCELNGIQECYFLSANTREFSDTVDKNSFHNDISSNFKRVKVKFFTSIFSFFENIEEVSATNSIMNFSIVENEKYSYQAVIKKTPLESLYYIYNDLFKEINFIPHHILGQYYPFATDAENPSYFNLFQMHDVDPSLINFYKNLKLQKDSPVSIKNIDVYSSIRDYDIKTKFVVRKLNDNLVFHISDNETREIVCTHHNIALQVDDAVQSQNEFAFARAIEFNDAESSELKEKLKQAYVFTKLTNYKAANKLYDEICEIALPRQEYISYFIAKYNQKHLAMFLGNIFFNSNLDQTLIDRLNQIDIIEEAVKLKSKTSYKLLSYICKEDFFKMTFQNISDTVANIVAHYKSQLQGGWSTNSHIEELEEKFVKMEEFLENNYIIYNDFLNYKNLFNQIIEGLFASYAISKKQDSRLQYLNDYWISKFVRYADKKKLIALYNRYLTGFIEVKNTDTSQSLLSIIQNLIDSKEKMGLFGKDFLSDQYYGFQNSWDEYFEKALVMAGILDIDKKELNNIGDLLVKYLKLNPNFKNRFDNPFTFFLNRKGKMLTYELKHAFLQYYLDFNECDPSLSFAVLASFEDEELKLSDDNYTKLINNCLDKCVKCGTIHEQGTLTFLFPKVTKEMQERIKIDVTDKMKQQTSFDIFYIASLGDIIPGDKIRILEYASRIKPTDKSEHTPSFFGHGYRFQNSHFDSILNLAFKYDIDTSTKEFINIKEHHPYYAWLLNPDEFNYDDFEVEWILLPKTKYYNQRLSKHTILISFLFNYLIKNNHPGLQKALLEILFYK